MMDTMLCLGIFMADLRSNQVDRISGMQFTTKAIVCVSLEDNG